jgi:hypothetical protein
MGRERKLLVANWKMHFVRAQALEYLKIFTERVRNIKKTELVLAPPFTLLETVGRALQKTQIKLAAQNLFYERQGAFTGEISPVMLKDVGCQYVIVGHSERRRLFGETDEIINKKLRLLLTLRLLPFSAWARRSRSAAPAEPNECSRPRFAERSQASPQTSSGLYALPPKAARRTVQAKPGL